MFLCVRATISIDERILEAVKRKARERGLSVSAFIAGVLDDALKRTDEHTDERPFRLVRVGGGGPREGIDLDRPRAMFAAEDEERFG